MGVMKWLSGIKMFQVRAPQAALSSFPEQDILIHA